MATYSVARLANTMFDWLAPAFIGTAYYTIKCYPRSPADFDQIFRLAVTMHAFVAPGFVSYFRSHKHAKLGFEDERTARRVVAHIDELLFSAGIFNGEVTVDTQIDVVRDTTCCVGPYTKVTTDAGVDMARAVCGHLVETWDERFNDENQTSSSSRMETSA